MDTINERSTHELVLTFRDGAGEPVTPTAGSYNIIDVRTGVQILAPTVFAPSADTHTLLITAEDTRSISGTPFEKRNVAVSFSYDGDKEGTGVYLYQVKALLGIG